MKCMSADICDQFPMIDKDLFTREALNAFCFPEGLKMRIIPRCALDNAARLGYTGKKSDRYQIHVVGESIFFTILFTERSKILPSTINEIVS